MESGATNHGSKGQTSDQSAIRHRRNGDAGSRCSVVAALMAHHRFKLGQTVVAHAPGMPPGPYIITRLLPMVGSDPHYQGRGEGGVVRALLESQIKPVSVTSHVEERVFPKRL
jgi:hypothetical protein